MSARDPAAALAQAEQDRDEARKEWPASVKHFRSRAESAEARLAQVHEAMEFIAAHPNGVGNHHPAFVARRWLAGDGE